MGISPRLSARLRVVPDGPRSRPEGVSWAPVLGAPAIGLVLLIAWLLPLAWWAIAIVGVASTVIFVLVLGAHRQFGRRLFARPAVLAALVMYTIALFTLAYAAVALEQAHSIETNGDGRPGSLGVAALLATSMGIAGGEVGVQVRDGARVIAHIQLLLVIGAVAGAGGQLIQRLTGQASDDKPPAGPGPVDPILDLYARVYGRLTEGWGDMVLQESGVTNAEQREQFRRRLQRLPRPDTVSRSGAIAVFERIMAGDLEF